MSSNREQVPKAAPPHDSSDRRRNVRDPRQGQKVKSPRSTRAPVLGLITARGGSRSVPRKNIAQVGGRPLIGWTIEAALQSGLLDQVIVSTDDPEIAEISRHWGADVPFLRPRELARDRTPHLPVVAHALEWLETQRGFIPDYVMLLQPTSPLRTALDIRASLRVAFANDADAVISVCAARPHPSICVRIGRSGRLSPFDPSVPLDRRRQDLAPVYAMNGAIYLTRRRVLFERGTFYPSRTFAYVMPVERSLDIDDEFDLRLADFLLTNLLVCAERNPSG